MRVLAPGGSPGPSPRYEDAAHAGGASAAQDGCERRVWADARASADDDALCSLLDAVDAALVDAREALLVACDEALASLVTVGIGKRAAAEVATLCFGNDAAGASRAGGPGAIAGAAVDGAGAALAVGVAAAAGDGDEAGASFALSAVVRTGSTAPCSASRNGSRSPKVHSAALDASAASTTIAANAAALRMLRERGASARGGATKAATSCSTAGDTGGATTVTAVTRPERATWIGVASEVTG